MAAAILGPLAGFNTKAVFTNVAAPLLQAKGKMPIIGRSFTKSAAEGVCVSISDGLISRGIFLAL